MIFGDQNLIEYEDGFSIKENKTSESELPDFVFRRSSLFMVSRSVEALTHTRIATPKGIPQNLEKGGYNDFHSLFNKSFETYRTIKAEIDVDSLPETLYCISRADGQLKAKLADTIKIEIREVIEAEQQEIYCGNFFFHDAITESNDGDTHVNRVLEFHSPLTSASFSKIFDAIKAGDNFLGLSVMLPAYVDWADNKAGHEAAIQLLAPDDASANFIMLSGVFSRKVTNTDNAGLENLNVLSKKNDEADADSLAEIYTLLDVTNQSLNESKNFLKTISMCMVLLVPFVAVATLKILL
ncbi:hypothetical protein GWD52_07945 [Enterobacteriaceae bacterium 4M9]|nr:hypothetical protein [Enterobacteriaceae bacterium 4M9]